MDWLDIKEKLSGNTLNFFVRNTTSDERLKKLIEEEELALEGQIRRQTAESIKEIRAKSEENEVETLLELLHHTLRLIENERKEVLLDIRLPLYATSEFISKLQLTPVNEQDVKGIVSDIQQLYDGLLDQLIAFLQKPVTESDFLKREEFKKNIDERIKIILEHLRLFEQKLTGKDSQDLATHLKEFKNNFKDLIAYCKGRAEISEYIIAEAIHFLEEKRKLLDGLPGEEADHLIRQAKREYASVAQKKLSLTDKKPMLSRRMDRLLMTILALVFVAGVGFRAPGMVQERLYEIRNNIAKNANYVLTKADIDFMKTVGQTLAAGAKMKGLDLPAKLVQHYFDGNGRPYDINPAYYKNHKGVRSAQEQMISYLREGYAQKKIAASGTIFSDMLQGKKTIASGNATEKDWQHSGVMYNGIICTGRKDNPELAYYDRRFRLGAKYSFNNGKLFIEWFVHSFYDFENDPEKEVPVPVQLSGMKLVTFKIPDIDFKQLARQHVANEFVTESRWNEEY
jgi:hypothetical protein